MSENRRKRRRNTKIKHEPKGDITKTDKIIAVIVMLLIFIFAAIAAIYLSLDKAGVNFF